MEFEHTIVNTASSMHSRLGSLVLSVLEVKNSMANVVVGRPGSPNVKRTLCLSEAILFETPDAGLLEVRAFKIGVVQVDFLVTQISPSSGVAAGFVDSNPDNALFTQQEIRRIELSMDQVKERLLGQGNIEPEKIDLIIRKLDEIKSASERLGRKDWKNLTIGTLTSVVVNSALDIETARTLFIMVSESLSWLFEATIKMIV